MRALLFFTCFVAPLVGVEEWGTPSKGLQMALALQGQSVVFLLKKVQANREIYLPLGRPVGIGRAEFLHLYLIRRDGTRRQLQYTGGNGVAPGRIQPYIVPMMSESVYTVETPLRYWRLGADLQRMEPELEKGAALQATITAAESFQWANVNCYGLQIFWSGRAASNVVPMASKSDTPRGRR